MLASAYILCSCFYISVRPHLSMSNALFVNISLSHRKVNCNFSSFKVAIHISIGQGNLPELKEGTTKLIRFTISDYNYKDQGLELSNLYPLFICIIFVMI